MLVLSLAVIGAVVVVWAHLCVHLVSRQERRSEQPAGRTAGPPALRLGRRPRPPRLLPEGHRPPAGLGPLSPSERFLRAEADRGLRELQLFLVDVAA